MSHHSSISTLPAHSAVHAVPAIRETSRRCTGLPEAANSVDRPMSKRSAEKSEAAKGMGAGADEFNRKCQGAYPVRPSNKPLLSNECLADASRVGEETDQTQMTF